MKKIILPIIIITICVFFTIKCTIERIIYEITESAEIGYFEGQKDAMNGDIRIKISKDSCYYWYKSPWDDNTKPIYIPEICK